MGAHCCHSHPQEPAAKVQPSPAYRRVLWLALWINFAMFALEIGAGLRAESVSLLADSLDFFGDAANYALSLLVLGMSLAGARYVATATCPGRLVQGGQHGGLWPMGDGQRTLACLAGQ
jgi:Co/Zn/Cd efflux system component